MLQNFLQIYDLSIVLVGDFNPVIIQPFWLVNKKLIGELEGENAKVELIHSELVKFSLDWANIHITKERFEIRTSKEPYFETARDLVENIFKILRETPIKNLGINHARHFAMPDEERFKRFGDKLVPLSNWDYLKNPRVLQLEILENNRRDNYNGYYRISIEPSELLKNSFGILINVNDHYSLKENETGRSGELVSVLSKNWESSKKLSLEIIEKLSEKI